ncbi:NADPH:quinone reductase [bacterium A37T11]|nr:NADPH:quinone reductase [bacterium A37T11]
MKAIVLDGVHKPFQIKDVKKPTLAANEVLVRVKAVALNRRDWWIQQGQYAGLKFPLIPGSDGTGIVEAVGSPSEERWLGQEVMIYPANDWGDSELAQDKDFTILGLPDSGTFAELVKVKVHNLFILPYHLSFEEAAAFPLAGLTAYRALFCRAKLKKGERLLINGIGGGVATFALQWALHMGIDVYVTSSKKEKIKRALDMGAKDGVLYTDPDWVKQLRQKGFAGFDVIFDSALGDSFPDLLDLAISGGRIVFCGGTAGNLPPLNGRKIFWKQLSILGTTMGSPKDFKEMMDFVNHHKVKPVVDSVYPIALTEKAIQKMATSDQFGKIVLRAEWNI